VLPFHAFWSLSNSLHFYFPTIPRSSDQSIKFDQASIKLCISYSQPKVCLLREYASMPYLSKFKTENEVGSHKKTMPYRRVCLSVYASYESRLYLQRWRRHTLFASSRWHLLIQHKPAANMSTLSAGYLGNIQTGTR
jgi:hypothetical protein